MPGCANITRRTLLNVSLSCLLTGAVVTAGCSAVAVPSLSQTQSGVAGRVIDATTRKGLPDATVSTQGRSSVTTVAGQYSIQGLQKGDALVVVTHSGFTDIRQTVTITGMFSTITGTWSDPADFEMEPQR
jgi:hypothetical protein